MDRPAPAIPARIATLSLHGEGYADDFGNDAAAVLWHQATLNRSRKRFPILADSCHWDYAAVIRGNYGRVTHHDERDAMARDHPNARNWLVTPEVDLDRWTAILPAADHAALAECYALDLPGSERTDPTPDPDEVSVTLDDQASYLRMLAEESEPDDPRLAHEDAELAELGLIARESAIA